MWERESGEAYIWLQLEPFSNVTYSYPELHAVFASSLCALCRAEFHLAIVLADAFQIAC